MKVLLSIKPEYAEKILLGEKRFEFRKAVPKNAAVRTIVIYATMPVGKVVGEFEVGGILAERPRNIWSMTSAFAGITKRFFNEYFEGRTTAYAIKVKSPKRYDKPLDLSSVLTSGIPPQSFCYLH
ncbi:hypothetical protein BJI69_06080 [Luteibacter rhizovicinus DSM 16549]|uniref:Uncharacterized protein n=1 Tax=Luteibacter rhizovicinus DSM 16549 TaxID=1440763 RepID=A0A0G9H5B6_9GAMM|nr:ASCH domain-containing protein [Luteibacter rhizovicinus]APG03522.1 hypothetical protein BJI69_06080 [Luteibacter rhizovicinus DSM 16549]KLD64768.1 hypothetical protein Y883_17295 [Luteibacter rhizovicinus DSM 16549]KLD79046.1 hypothetical protein Y886_06725 [Xanthomonas hyacinthi DSM 19077]